MIVFTRTTKCQFEPGKFSGITSLGTGAVGFDQLDGFRAKTGHLVGAGQRTGLACGQGRIHAVGAAIRGRPDTTDDGIHPVPIALGIVQALERHHGNAFTQHRAVGGIRERAAVARG